MEAEALKVVSKENNETEAAERDYMVDDEDIFTLICKMSAINGALAALNDDLLNNEDAKDTLIGCEYLSRDLISDLRDMYEEVTK